LLDGCGVAAGGDSDVNIFAENQHIAAVHCGGRGDMHQRKVGSQSLDDGFRFGLARISPRAGDDRHFGQDEGGVFHKNRVGQIRFGGQFNYLTTDLRQRVHVFFVLGIGNIEVDGCAVDVGDFTFVEARADFSGDGDGHFYVLFNVSRG